MEPKSIRNRINIYQKVDVEKMDVQKQIIGGPRAEGRRAEGRAQLVSVDEARGPGKGVGGRETLPRRIKTRGYR